MIMKRNYGLSNTEMTLMDIFWEGGNRSFTFKELLEQPAVVERGWKKQTLGTYLSNLQKSSLLGVDTSGKNYVYYPMVSKDEYVHQWTEKLVRTSFDNSISKLVSAFTGGKKLSQEEAEEIRRLLSGEGGDGE